MSAAHRPPSAHFSTRGALAFASITLTTALTGCHGDFARAIGPSLGPALSSASLYGGGSSKQKANTEAQPPSRSRPMVLGNPTQLADLYMDGELTDTKGYRWDVAIIPGISPTLEGAGDSYARAGGYIRRFGTDGLVKDGKSNAVGDMYRFAGPDCLGDYVAGGIGRDYRHTSADIADLVNDKPFGWYAQVAWRSTWGYVLKPVGRIVTGVPASAVAATAATAAGSIEGTGRIVMATSDVAVMGTIYPTGRLLWHQPAYLVSIFNAEPALAHDGKWGLHIIGHPATDPVPPAETAN